MSKEKFNQTASCKILCTLMIAMVIVSFSSLSAQYINVHKEDKLIRSFSIQDVQKLSFSNGSLLLKKKENVTYEIFATTEIEKIIFGQQEITANVKSQKNDDHVVIYPNPVNDSFVIESPFEILEVHIFDLNGKNIFNLNPIANKIVVPFGSYPKGLYIVKVITRQITYTNKIIK